MYWISGEDGELVVPDARAWGERLGRNHADSAGVMLVLAKKGTTSPTSLTYDQALEEAICFGWIDGQVRRRDERTHFQRFTPRRPRNTLPIVPTVARYRNPNIVWSNLCCASNG